MRIAVIGGGAAGFMGAITAAESSDEAEVHLFEKSDKLLAKVRISGGGRCNVTHSCFDPAELISYYPRGSKELLSLFHRFQPADTIEWFYNRAVELKVEEDGRMFPVTDSSSTIVSCLMKAAAEAGVKIRVQDPVQRLKKEGKGFVLGLKEENLYFDKVLIATGGSPKRESYQWLEELGHSIQSPVPSLFTFNIPDKALHQLSGLSVPKAQLLLSKSYEAEGPMLITHWGLSGPAVLRISAWAARYLAGQNYNFEIFVNWIADQHDVLDQLRNIKVVEAKKMILSNSHFALASRLWIYLCEKAGLPEGMRWADLSEKLMLSLHEELTHCKFLVKGKTTFKEEFVTCGGVTLSEVDFRTMESKVLPGLYFAGEVLNIDGITGGFNFQAAWSAGYVAGLNMARTL